MSARQFYGQYVAPLPRRFHGANEGIMAGEHLRAARAGLEHLVRDAGSAVPRGCDQVKNTFLGGMRENESWGLRKWLSRHGGAGSICNDVEELTRNVKALPKGDEATKRLTAVLRPIARQAQLRLKKDVPAAYQEQSSAHPYLPFFHRLEACLRQMASYDPEEDDVICLDDSDEEDAAASSFSKGGGGRKASAIKSLPPKKRGRDDGGGSWKLPAKKRRHNMDDFHANAARELSKMKAAMMESPHKRAQSEVVLLDESEDDAAKPTAGARRDRWRCPECTFLNEPFATKCIMCSDDDASSIDVGALCGALFD